MLFRFLILVHVCTAFPLKCPEPAQWSTRARGFCPDPSKYFCLKNDLINGYSENCTMFDFLQPGRKHVLRGGLDADICSSERYQPWPILFYTNVSTNCIFHKSACNEEGQVVYDDGNRSIDITCRCDYTRGYDFIAKPRNRCFCVPSEEDCSCHLKMCPKATDKLSPDYECLEEEKNLTVSECKTIIAVRTNKTRDDNTKKYISDSENMSNEVINKKVFTAICIGSILFICMGLLLDELLDRYYREVYFIYQPLSDIELIEGQTARLKYKLSTNRFKVLFMKDNQFFRETTFIKKSVVGRSKTLEFTNVAPTDAGTYCLKVAEMTSNQINMIIKPVFTSKIDPQESLEGNKLELVCSVYADSIVVQWYKENEQVHDCDNMLIDTNKNQRRLTIKKATIMDSGMYYVKAGNVQMEIPVIVKDMFRRPLVDVTIMEDLDAKFQCETEEEKAPVQWFYNNKEINESTERRKISTFEERGHALTILKTKLADSGKYSIRIKAYDKCVELNVKEMPETIKNMSFYDKDAFLKAANTGITTRYNIRVMIVGKHSAGKTCLLRRLMNEEIDDVICTDGINIERRKCHIDIKTGEWHFDKSGQNPQVLSIDPSEDFAECVFWDFAGQKEFYATHQTFLSANAVYLLVVDISEDFKSKTYEDMLEKKFDSIGEYIDFWLDNIHCYCTDDKNTSMECNEDGTLNPPVIIVGTGIDKIPLNDRENRKLIFIDHLNSIMSIQEKQRHFRQPHFLSNKNPSDNKQEFKELRTDILSKAKALSNWEENLPIRWVFLEKEMYRKQTDTAILSSEANGETPRHENEKVISYTEAESLANAYTFSDIQKGTSELDSFLKYEHEIGNIVFFKEVREYIVLDPEWLVDVFKCFVSHQYKDTVLGMTAWTELKETGKLADTLIGKLLTKVPSVNLTEHKQYLLELMEEFDIIVKPKNDDFKNYIYMPCMIKPVEFESILGKGDEENKHLKMSSWFCLVFNFLPPSYFNHILVGFVKKKQLFHEKKNGKLSIYRNMGIFQLNLDESEKLIICLSKNLIAMQVRQFNNEDVCYSYIKNELINLVKSIETRYHINVTYEIRFKCPAGSHDANEGIDYDRALKISQYFCENHKEMHSCKDIYRSWFKEEEVQEEHKIRGHRKCNFCENMSVYNCHDCNHALCEKCSRKHNEENKYQSHLMQLLSDRFILSRKYNLKMDMLDINCLPNGLIVIVGLNLDNLKHEVMTISVNGIQRRAIQLENRPLQMVVVDKHTVVILLTNNNLAIVDTQQNHVEYIGDSTSTNQSISFINIENRLYLAEELGLAVIDMTGSVKRSIPLSFTPCYMCNDIDSQHIYCIDSDSSKLICIDKEGTTIFIYTDPSMTNLNKITVDHEGNVLGLCRKRDDNSEYVIKVDSKGKSSEVVITNIKKSRDNCICFHRLDNSLVIGVYNEVYIYTANHKVNI